jgi:DNA replication and repair protein RecF
MRLLRLHLDQFRCYSHLDLPIPPGGLRLYGENASGKTSLLEAIYMLSTTRSPRASVERELIRFDPDVDYGLPPYARIAGRHTIDHGEHSIELALTMDASDGAATRKRIKIDGQPRRAIDTVGRLKVVLFQPEDLELVLGSPSVRRRYLDILLATLEPIYLRTLSQYGRILEQRNSLLRSLRDRGGRGAGDLTQLEYWDSELLTRAAYLVALRVRSLGQLRQPLAERFARLSGHSEPTLTVCYDTSLELTDGQLEQIEGSSLADAQRILQHALERALETRRTEEFRRAVTVLGPHRDDFRLTLDGRDLSAFGSRGQQRLGVVALKLAELQTVRDVSGELPVLLLDDVLSELDEVRRAQLLALLGRAGCQTIVTATDQALLEVNGLDDLPMYQVVAGEVVADDG